MTPHQLGALRPATTRYMISQDADPSGSFFIFFIAVATLFVVARAHVYGHWEKIWRTPSSAKRGTNVKEASSRWNNVQLALRESAPVLRRLQSTRYISIGGGQANSRRSGTPWTASTGPFAEAYFRSIEESRMRNRA